MEANLELRQLRYFVAVAEELNFTRAAERLQIAQPPLSRQIQALEKKLQLALFQRTNRRVTLTPAGGVFLSECRQILSQVEQSIRVTQRAAQGETGQLTLGFEGSFHNGTVLGIIQAFRDKFPDVTLALQEMPSGQQIDALLSQHIDVGFLNPILSKESISFITLLTEPLVVVMAASHSLADQDTLNFAQLEKESWITGQSNQGCGLLLHFREICRQAGFVPNIQQETNDIQMRLGFVAAKLGITLLPLSAIGSERSDLVYKEIACASHQIELALAWRSNAISPVLKSFLNVVQDISQ